MTRPVHRVRDELIEATLMPMVVRVDSELLSALELDARMNKRTMQDSIRHHVRRALIPDQPEVTRNADEKALDDIIRRLLQVRKGWRTFEQRCGAWIRGGYPSTTDGGPTGKGSVSDPTAREAVNGDEVRALLRKEREIIAHIGTQAVMLWSGWNEITQASPTKVTPKDRGIAKCGNQYGCPDDNWADKAGRCNTCYQYRYRNNRDRTGRESREEIDQL